MSSAELTAAGLGDLLSDLLVMPTSKRPTPPMRSALPTASNLASSARPTAPDLAGPRPPQPVPRTRAPPENSDALLRASDSNVQPKAMSRVSNTRTRAASGGTTEEMANASASPSSSSPRGVLASIRARVARGRTHSQGDEADMKSPTFLKERRSPRSPRGTEDAVLPGKQKSLSQVSRNPDEVTPLHRRPSEPTVQVRRPSDRPSLDDARRHSPVSPLVTTSFGAVKSMPERPPSPAPRLAREILVPEPNDLDSLDTDELN